MIKVSYDEKSNTFKFRSKCKNNQDAVVACMCLVYGVLKKIDNHMTETIHDDLLKMLADTFEAEKQGEANEV